MLLAIISQPLPLQLYPRLASSSPDGVAGGGAVAEVGCVGSPVGKGLSTPLTVLMFDFPLSTAWYVTSSSMCVPAMWPSPPALPDLGIGVYLIMTLRDFSHMGSVLWVTFQGPWSQESVGGCT